MECAPYMLLRKKGSEFSISFLPLAPYFHIIVSDWNGDSEFSVAALFPFLFCIVTSSLQQFCILNTPHP